MTTETKKIMGDKKLFKAIQKTRKKGSKASPYVPLMSSELGVVERIRKHFGKHPLPIEGMTIDEAREELIGWCNEFEGLLKELTKKCLIVEKNKLQDQIDYLAKTLCYWLNRTQGIAVAPSELSIKTMIQKYFADELGLKEKHALERAIRKFEKPDKDYVALDGHVWKANESSCFCSDHIKGFLRMETNKK